MGIDLESEDRREVAMAILAHALGLVSPTDPREPAYVAAPRRSGKSTTVATTVAAVAAICPSSHIGVATQNAFAMKSMADAIGAASCDGVAVVRFDEPENITFIVNIDCPDKHSVVVVTCEEGAPRISTEKFGGPDPVVLIGTPRCN